MVRVIESGSWGGCQVAVIGATLACAPLTATPAAAQDRDTLQRIEQISRELDAQYRLRISPDQPVFERLLLDARVLTRFSFAAVDDEFSSTRILRQSEAQLQLLAQLDGAHTVYGRFRALYNDFNSGDSFDGRGDEFETPIGDRYWYQYDDRGRQVAQTGTSGPISIGAKVGRDYYQWGSGLSLSNTMYHTVANLDVGPLTIKGLFGQTPASQTVDWDASRPEYDNGATERRYYGGELEWRVNGGLRPFVSYLVQRDHGDRDFALIETALNEAPTFFDYDSEYLGFGVRGTLGAQWTYQFEVVYETGETLSSPFEPDTGQVVNQTRDDIKAWAGVGSISFLFRDPGDTRLTFEAVGGSGDDDRLDANNTFAGNAPGTNDNAFNSLGFVNTGLALAPEVTNLLMLRWGVSTSLRPRYENYDWLRLGVDVFAYMKSDRDAPISTTTVEKRFLGTEVDAYIDWQLASDVVASLRYGVFLPDRQAFPAGEDDPRHFLFAGVTIEF